MHYRKNNARCYAPKLITYSGCTQPLLNSNVRTEVQLRFTPTYEWLLVVAPITPAHPSLRDPHPQSLKVSSKNHRNVNKIYLTILEVCIY